MTAQMSDPHHVRLQGPIRPLDQRDQRLAVRPRKLSP
jgi:hypothetical protein